MSVEVVKQKLAAAGINPENWLNPEHLQFSSFFHQLTNDELAVYFSWLKQQKQIILLLKHDPKVTGFQNEFGISKHAQFEQFKTFVTPLVYPVLKDKSQAITNLHNARIIVSFSTVLDDEHQDRIQDTVADWLDNFRTNFLKHLENAASDQYIFNYIHQELTPEFWELLNSFNPRHYRVKAKWMEVLVNFIRHKKASKRLIQGILSKLTLLEVNSEHRTELNTLKNDIRLGKIKVEAVRVPWKRIIILSSVLVVLTLSIFWIMLIPAKHEKRMQQEDTSFMELSQKERFELDSLLDDYKQKNILSEEENYDSYLQAPPSELVTLHASSDELFWKYHRNWKKKNNTTFALSFTNKNKSKKLLPGTLSLKDKKGSSYCAFTNKSKFCALVIVFDEMNADYMFCEFVQPGEKSKFAINPKVEKLVIVPGGEIEKTLTKNELPFKQVNQSFFYQLDKIYSVDEDILKFKLVYEDYGTNGVVLIDLNKVLSL